MARPVDATASSHSSGAGGRQLLQSRSTCPNPTSTSAILLHSLTNITWGRASLSMVNSTHFKLALSLFPGVRYAASRRPNIRVMTPVTTALTGACPSGAEVATWANAASGVSGTVDVVVPVPAAAACNVSKRPTSVTIYSRIAIDVADAAGGKQVQQQRRRSCVHVLAC
ncbi:hypothetical protein PLESTM_002029300 [Pleodorina starrii]|nr:hypothetical protein PLESTM_002029300 [Pleodorina starrii]